jgi:hypothetical protein
MNFHDLFGMELRNGDADVRTEFDLEARAEDLQRFAHRSAADGKAIGQILLAQVLAGPQFPVFDHAAHFIGDGGCIHARRRRFTGCSRCRRFCRRSSGGRARFRHGFAGHWFRRQC